MYSILHEIFKDHKDGPIFKCFGLWHLLYIFIGIGIIVFLIIYLKKHQDKQIKYINNVINIAFGLYMLDLFIMPLAYGEIDIEKLPFHICTCMCVLSFISRRNNIIGKYKYPIALLGMISNFVYFIYPAGVGWYQVTFYSYRVIQTLGFHYIMMVYGILVLVFERKNMDFKDFKYDCLVLLFMTVWALLGNYIYNYMGNPPRFYNWFFVVGDPFSMLDLKIAQFIMPFVTYAAFICVDFMVYLIYNLINKKKVTNVE